MPDKRKNKTKEIQKFVLNDEQKVRLRAAVDMPGTAFDDTMWEIIEENRNEE